MRCSKSSQKSWKQKSLYAKTNSQSCTHRSGPGTEAIYSPAPPFIFSLLADNISAEAMAGTGGTAAGLGSVADGGGSVVVVAIVVAAVEVVAAALLCLDKSTAFFFAIFCD